VTASINLSGLSVLITRPRGRGETLASAIRNAGGSVREVPLLAVEPLHPERDAELRAVTAAKLKRLDQYDAAIAISINAVELALSWAREYWPQWPPQLRWYGIGAATAEALTQWGVRCTAAGGGMNSEALLALPELQAIATHNILILRGIGGRETLADTLRARGATVDYAECYRRVEPILDAAARAELAAPVDAICVNSAETLTNLWNNLFENSRSEVLARALIVPSERVGQKARELGFQCVIVAANAGTAATLNALATLQRY
jgi:uroporphyrinogen-III synthase